MSKSTISDNILATRKPEEISAVYHLSDLVGEGWERHPWAVCGEWVVVQAPTQDPWYWVNRQWKIATSPYSHAVFPSEPTVTQIQAHAQEAIAGKKDAPLIPRISAQEVGERFRRRVRLTAGELLADPIFARLARKVAESGKSFSQELLAWEKKDVVREAVAIVRRKVEVERELALKEAEAKAQTAREKALREKPTRDAVLDAYRDCRFRQCKQGHSLRVEILYGEGDRGGVVAGVEKGEAYSSSCTWRKQESTHLIKVRHDWLSQVAERGLETLEGMLTVDARITGYFPTGEVMLTLRCVRQGRGTDLTIETVRLVEDQQGSHREPTRKEEASVIAYTDARVLRDAMLDAGHSQADRVIAEPEKWMSR